MDEHLDLSSRILFNHWTAYNPSLPGSINRVAQAGGAGWTRGWTDKPLAPHSGLRIAFPFLAIHKTTGFANQQLLAIRAVNLHIRLVDGDMGFALARVKRPATRFAHQGAFAKAALDHGARTCFLACL